MRHLALGHLPVCIFLFMENIAVEAEAEAEESRIRRSKQETRERKYAHRLTLPKYDGGGWLFYVFASVGAF